MLTPPTPPPAHSQRLQHDERLLKKLQSNAQREADLQTHHFAKHVCETSLRTSQQKHAER